MGLRQDGKRDAGSQYEGHEDNQAKSQAPAGSQRCHAGIHGDIRAEQANMQLSLRTEIVCGLDDPDPLEATGATRMESRKKLLRRIRLESDIWWSSISRRFPNPQKGDR